MGQPDFTDVVCAVCGMSLTRLTVTAGTEASGTWTHPPDGKDYGHEPVPGLFSPDGPRPEWRCDFCGSVPPSCRWLPGAIDPASPPSFLLPGLVDSSAGGQWMACEACSPLVAGGDLTGLLRRWRENCPVPPGADRKVLLGRKAPQVAALVRQLLDSGPSGPYPLP